MKSEWIICDWTGVHRAPRRDRRRRTLWQRKRARALQEVREILRMIQSWGDA